MGWVEEAAGPGLRLSQEATTAHTCALGHWLVALSAEAEEPYEVRYGSGQLTGHRARHRL